MLPANNDGLWNQKGASLELFLKPHFYQTRYFYALCALAFAFIVWAVYRFRLAQIQSRFNAVLEERTRISRELHDSVNQGLTGVSLQLEAIIQKPESTSLVTSLKTAAEMVRATLSESRRLIQDLRPAPLLNSDLHSALREVAQQITSGTSIRTSLTVRGTPETLSEPAEDTLFRVAQESISNAVKHGNPDQILLEIEYEKERMRMSIQDDGSGFDPARKGKANRFGLVGIRERVEQIGGNLQIVSQPEKGTRIEITVPMK